MIASYYTTGATLIVIALIVIPASIYGCWRWLTYGRYERRHRRQIDQHLADAERPVRIPIETHEGDWQWPKRLEENRLLRSRQ